MDTRLPSIGSQASFACWGRGAATGLRSYDGLSGKATAERWKKELLEGIPWAPSLLSLHNAGEPTFICPSRLSVLEFVAPRLTLLDAGELEGQQNCCAVFGTRELGKSTFLWSVAEVVALTCAPTTAVVALNFKSDGVSEPLHALQRLLALPSTSEGAASSTSACGDAAGDISAVLQHMVDHGRRVFLLIDDVEVLFRANADSVLAARVFRQLVIMGRWSGARPVVVILTGSAAVLRSLLFSNALADIAHEFPCHLKFGSLNHSKFIPFVLQPVTDTPTLTRAILCLSGGKGLFKHLASSSELVFPESAAGDSTRFISDPVAQGCSVAPALLERVALRSRGIAGHIISDCRGQLPREHCLERLLGPERDSNRIAALRRLIAGWEGSVRAAGNDVASVAAAAKIDGICNFSFLLPDTESSTAWYNLADAGVVSFVDSLLPRTVRLLHPTDAGALILALARQERAVLPSELLSPPECLSLLAPRLVGACDFNESLVMESLAWTSCQPAGLQLADGSVLRGLQHSFRGEVCMLSDASGAWTVDDILRRDRRGVLCKEYPDEHGGDGACLLNPNPEPLRVGATEDEPPAVASAASVSPSPYVLLRVQVKMTSALKASSISPQKISAMLDKLSKSSAALAALLSDRLHAPVVVRHVIWVSQYLSEPALACLARHPSCALAVRPGTNMLPLWSPRVRRFVEAGGLAHYGAPRLAS